MSWKPTNDMNSREAKIALMASRRLAKQRTEAVLKARASRLEQAAKERAEAEAEALRLHEENERQRVAMREAKRRAEEAHAARARLNEVQETQRAAMMDKLARRRTRQAKRFEQARQRALREAEEEERRNAVALAQGQRFKFPELNRFAAACGVAGDILGGASADEYSWLQLFGMIADAIPFSIMLVDMRVPGLPLTFCNRASSALTGYTSEEMVGSNCRFLQGKATQSAAVRNFSRAIRDARDTYVLVTNYRKDGTAFQNLVSLRPVFSDEGYVYCAAVQAEMAEGLVQDPGFKALRDALPCRASSEEEARAAVSAATADAQALGALAERKLLAAHRSETRILMIRLVLSLDWFAAMRYLLRFHDGHAALRAWLNRTREPSSVRHVDMLDVAHGVLARLPTCKSMEEATAYVLDDLAPKYLGDGSSAPPEMTGVLGREAAFHQALLRLRALAAAAVRELALNCLPRFAKSKACFRMLEGRTSSNSKDAPNLLWDPWQEYSRSVRAWVTDVGALGLGFSAAFCVVDLAPCSAEEDQQPVVFTNEAFCAATGQALEDVIGQPFGRVLCAEPEEADALTTLRTALASCADPMAMLSCRRRDGERFTALVGARCYMDERSRPRFAVSLHVELAPEQVTGVRELAVCVARLLRHLPIGNVPA